MALIPTPPSLLEERRNYEIGTDFLDPPPRQAAQYLIAELAADADLAAAVMFNPVGAIYLHDITITPEGSATGVDDSNTVLVVVSSGAGEVVNTTYNTTNTWPADNVQESIGTLLLPFVAAAGRLEIAVTQGTTANITTTRVTISYSDANAYPAPGFGILSSNNGTAAVVDGARGILPMSPGAVDNDEMYLFSNLEAYLFADEKPLHFAAYVQFTEANADDANIMVGLMDAVGADSLLDDAGGPKASYSGAVFYKVDGGTVWVCESSNATTQVSTTTTVTAGGSTYQRLQIRARSTTATTMDIEFLIDGVLVAKHNYTVASATEMQLVAAVKNGSANAETLNVDWIGCKETHAE